MPHMPICKKETSLWLLSTFKTPTPWFTAASAAHWQEQMENPGSTAWHKWCADQYLRRPGALGERKFPWS